MTGHGRYDRITYMPKQWNLKQSAPQEFFKTFPELSPVIAQILYNRGIVDPKQVSAFLNPKYENQNDPFLFLDMTKACERIWQAIFNNEKILIYGDYDADAVTANALMHQTFRYLGVDILSYIPDRFTEGYGLNLEAFEKIKAQGANVVITVDCGTNSVDVADFCRENGIDLIITDHHEITGETPQSFALINPKNPKEQYPDDQITGVGVAYKLASALLSDKSNVAKSKNIQPQDVVVGWDKWLLDLVAIGTVADCHSLLGENRILVGLGLKVLAKTKWLGLRHLMMSAGIEINSGKLDARALGFVIAPRINAAGRLEHADIALKLLISTEPDEAVKLAGALEQINKRRQDITMRAVSEAEEQVVSLSDRKVLLLTSQDWPKGVVGLIAGRLAETYKKPVIILERGEFESTGSARTGGSFNIVEALKSTSHLLVKFGGHKQAAGLTVKTEHIELFYQNLLEYAESINYEALEPSLEVDAEIFENSINLETADLVASLEPFGAGNTKPIFMINNVSVVSSKAVGKEGQHLQLNLCLGQTFFSCIAFSFGYLVERLSNSDIIDIVVEFLIDEWNGNRRLKFRIIDIKLHE